MRGLIEIARLADEDVQAVLRLDGAPIGIAELAEERARPWSRIWVAREDDEGAVAFVMGWHVVDEFHVLNLATRSDRRRRGIARALMREVLDYGRAHGLRRMLLEARRSNAAAIGLYASLGFSTTGIRQRYYSDDEDAVEMALDLPGAQNAPSELESPGDR